MRVLTSMLFTVTLSALPAQERPGDALHELSDQMLQVEEAIRRTDTGRRTQVRQQRIIEQLQTMIDALRPVGEVANGAKPRAAGTGNVLPPGRPPAGKPKDCTEQRWIGLSPRERARIEQEVTSQLPKRYKRMLEEYYKKMGRR